MATAVKPDALTEFFLFEQGLVHRKFKSSWGGKSGALDRLLDGLSHEQLRSRPLPGLNSIAWLIWHIARCEDIGTSAMVAGETEVLDTGHWAKRLGISRRDLATGMSDEEVSDFTAAVDIDALLEYSDAVGQRTEQLVRAISPGAWSQVPDQVHLKRLSDQGTFGPGAQNLITTWTGKPRWFFMRLATTHSLGHIYEGTTIKSLLPGR